MHNTWLIGTSPVLVLSKGRCLRVEEKQEHRHLQNPQRHKGYASVCISSHANSTCQPLLVSTLCALLANKVSIVFH